MSQTSCQNLREKFETIKELKKQFDALLKETKNLENINELKTQSDSLKDQIGNLRLELFENLESIKTLKKQYFNQVDTLEKLEICSKEEPFITDINGLTYQLPSFKQILAGITFETIKKLAKLKKPQFLLTPIGLSFESLIEKIDAYKLKTIPGRSEDITTIYPDFNERDKSPVQKKIYYFPKNLQGINCGQTKNEVLQARGGWLLSIVDLEPQKRPKQRTKGSDPHKIISPTDEFKIMFEEKLKLGLRGMTIEEYLILDIAMQRKNNSLFENKQIFLDGTIASRTIEDMSTNAQLTGELECQQQIRVRVINHLESIDPDGVLHLSVLDIII